MAKLVSPAEMPAKPSQKPTKGKVEIAPIEPLKKAK